MTVELAPYIDEAILQETADAQNHPAVEWGDKEDVKVLTPWYGKDENGDFVPGRLIAINPGENTSILRITSQTLIMHRLVKGVTALIAIDSHDEVKSVFLDEESEVGLNETVNISPGSAFVIVAHDSQAHPGTPIRNPDNPPALIFQYDIGTEKLGLEKVTTPQDSPNFKKFLKSFTEVKYALNP